MSARALRELHVPGRPLILPNVWDAASARLVADAGFPAVATSSAAVAEALGHPDGERAPASEMFASAARISRAVEAPVTVDVEAGYGLDPDELVRRLLDAGAAGCNVEDTDHATGVLRDAAEHAEWLSAVCSAAEGRLVINARVDSFLHAAAEPGVFDQAVERARRYLEAGADCVYPIFLDSGEGVRAFVDAVRPHPVNVLGVPGGIGHAVAAELGVARLSLGPGLFRAQQDWLRTHLCELAPWAVPSPAS